MTYLVCFYSDGQLWVSTQLILVSQWQQTDFVKCIRGIADQLPQKDLKGMNYEIDPKDWNQHNTSLHSSNCHSIRFLGSYLLVPVQRIDNKLHHPVDLCLECMLFCFLPHFFDLKGTVHWVLNTTIILILQKPAYRYPALIKCTKSCRPV